MKVLMVNTVDTARNGITNVIFNYVVQLKDSGIVFDLVTKNVPDHSYVEQIEEHGGRVHVIPRSMRRIWKYFTTLKKVVKENQYDLVHIHGNSHTLVIELLAAKLGGCKARIAHGHSTGCNSLALHKCLTAPFDGLCTHRLACGNEAGQFLHGKHSFAVMRNGIDVKKYLFSANARCDYRNRYGIEARFVLGHVGMFDEVKNQSFLLDILNELLKTDCRYHLLLIGEGPLQEMVKEKATDLQIKDYVTFVGGTDCVSEHLSAMDMIVMPSLHEGLPLSLIEAQASGLRCLVSDNITREVDKTGNLTFLPLDAGAACWACEIGKMSAEVDRTALSQKAIEKIKTCGHDIQTEAAALYRYYEDAAKV